MYHDGPEHEHRERRSSRRRGSPGRSRSSRSRGSPGRSRSRAHRSEPARQHVPEVDDGPFYGRAGGGRADAAAGGAGALDALEQQYASRRHRSAERPRSQPRSGSPSRSSRRRASPGRSQRRAASPSRADASAQMVLLQQEQALAHDGAEQDAVVTGLTEEIVALNRSGSELMLRNEYLLSHQTALEDEVVHLHGELTKSAADKERLAREVQDLGSKLERSRSDTEELAGLLEKVLFGAESTEMHSAATSIQARFRGRKARREAPAIPARDPRGVAAGGRPAAAAAAPVGAGAASWGVSEVIGWLRTLQMGRYAGRFEAERIDGSTLLALGKEELAELDVGSGIHRAKIFGAIQQLSAA